MTIASKLEQYINDHGITYDLVVHPRTETASDSAHAAHIPGRRVAKTVVIHQKDAYCLAVVPSTHRIELDTLAEFIGARLGLATEEEIAELFDDCDVGAVPPVGAAYGLSVALDESLGEVSDVYFEGGDHRTLVHVKSDAFKELMKDAREGRFSHQA